MYNVDMAKKQFGLGRLIKSFRAAATGLGQTLRTEQNMRLHFLAMILVVIAGWWLQISSMEWLIICLCIGGVMSVELLNTALEYLADVTRDTLGLDYEATKYPRDMAAAGVLIMSIVSVIVGIGIFLPRLITMFGWG